MNKKKRLEDHSFYSSRQCLVCGDVARGLNFNVMTCMPCKTFFRKTALKQSNITCEFNKNCPITKLTRSFCSPCRLQKCLALGMNPQLIRSIPHSNPISNKTRRQPSKKDEKQIVLPTPCPLSLLRNDRSILTNNEWTLLANCLHAFDEENLLGRIQYSLDQLALLPPKLRLRQSNTFNIAAHFFQGLLLLIEHSPDLNSLSFDARRALTKYNLSSVGSINACFLCRELNLFKNPWFLNLFNVHYGTEFVQKCSRHSARFDPNGSLIKMMLFVMAFSSNCSIVSFNEQEPLSIMSSSIDLIRIQNIYITMLWKYYLYLYQFKEAVIRFSHFVKIILDLIHILELQPKNDAHDLMIETIVTETERVLLIQD